MHQKSSSSKQPSSGEALALLRKGPVLLYDGECGVCSQSVQWILRHERGHTLRFAPLDSKCGKVLIAEAEVSSDIDSVLWMEEQGGAVACRTHSNAVLRVLEYVGGPWRVLRGAIALVPGPLRDFAYRLFAAHRLGVAAPVCLVPSAKVRARFLEP